ncbi:MAG: TonB-dependent receptor [Ignavibacteriales bacterium]|nr:MAG: TonB-dependent receptor [Ignavibacteriales bacterium]
MLKRLRYILPLFFLVALLTADLAAQSGKVSGRVTDKVTNEALPFVNVIIEGTTQGAATDLDGYYNILNVAPGTYTIKASAIGYNSQSVSGVRVSIDLTSKIDFVLSETSLTLKDEVVVVATKPLVTKDLTASTAIVGADDIAALPVTEFQEVLGLKAGVVGNSVRGGRSGEVVYAIDGVPVTDVYDGGTVVDVNANSIQELQFVSGAFNAEYGKALSGYVNIATKDGKNTFEGNVTTYFGDYYSDRTDIFRAIDDFDPLSIHNFEGSLSGPIIPNSLYFYGNFRYVYFGGWLNGKRVFNPWDITTNLGASVPLENRYDIQKTGDGEIVPMNWNQKVYGQGKLTYRVIPEIKLTYNYMIDDVEYRDYDHSFAYNPDGDFKKFRTGHTNILGMTHTLGSSTFYQLNLSYFFKRFRQYVYEDYNDPKYTHNELLGQSPADVPSFRTGGTQSSHFKRTTGTYGVKFDITSQVTQIHQVKAGVEFNRHNLSFDNVNLIQPDGIGSPKDTRNPYVTLRVPDINNPAENLAIDIYTRNPVEFSAYLQDKIELSELIINIGLRYDMFMPDGKLLVDPSDPNIYNPLNPANIAKTLAERQTYWYKDASTKSQLSPRLGVAFPITDRGVIHFSYGYFFQIPPFDLLYTNPEFKFGQGTGNLGIAGNSDLRPQGTISGEVGVQQAITDDISIDLTAYFRDIRDLAGTRADEITLFGGSGRYSQFVNSDFGFVKGIVFTLTKRFSDGWSGTIDYTLQSAKGNASDPAATRNALVGGALPEIQLIRLNQDQTHTINVTFSYAAENWGLSMIGNYGSGFPYTPNQSINLSTLLTNSETKPTYVNADFRAYYDFKIMDTYKISFFTRIYNLFDIRNEVNVYGDSGTADFTVEEFLRRQQNLPVIVNTLDEWYRVPTNYSEPRRIEFGATLFF